jgi:phosphoribosylaminoimidazolecarboxamide formyltransferase/IMP cyclohydrolase
MSDLKKMYTTLLHDSFPEDLRITLGNQELVYKKRTWNIGGEWCGLRTAKTPTSPPPCTSRWAAS